MRFGLKQWAGISTASARLNRRAAEQRRALHQSESTKEDTGLLWLYHNKVVSGELREDDRQKRAAHELNRLWLDMQIESNQQQQQSSWDSLWSSFSLGKRSQTSPLGVYLYGGVGCGKTMMMDWLYDQAATNRRKRRCHFNEFMLDFHIRARHLKSSGDVIEDLANEVYDEAQFLCLDEMQVTDIADAVILRRLFHSLFAKGLILVTTSNRAPEALYMNGIQRELFLPFISLVRDRCAVVSLSKGTDYRYVGAAMGDSSGSYTVLSESEWSQNGDGPLSDKFFSLTGAPAPGSARSLMVSGRKIVIPGAVGQVAFFPFPDLCEKPLSANDYFTICANFHTVLVSRVPSLRILSNRNACRRFITFVDSAYDQKVKVLVSAEKPQNQLFDLEGITTSDTGAPDEAFATARTLSRLQEMQSPKYSENAWVAERT